MNVVTFDTHKAVEYLIKKGVKKGQAEGIVETLQRSREYDFNQLVTRDYLDAQLNKLCAEMGQIHTNLIIWLLGTISTATATIIGFLICLK